MAVDISGLPSPIQGVCYQPAPTDYLGNQAAPGKYWDSDFYNADFPGFWSTANGGRGDLANMADLGINFIHLYDWNTPQFRDHSTFLRECKAQSLAVAVPFNNSWCQNTGNNSWGENAVYSAMTEIYTTLGSGTAPYSAVVMWTISNEYNQDGPGDPSAAQIAQVAQVILYFESQVGATTVLPIAVPTSFAPANSPGIAPTQALRTAFSATANFTATINGSLVTIQALPSTFFADRIIGATNPENPGSIPPAASGVTIASWLPTFAAAFPSTPVWFSEIGIGIQNCCSGWPTPCTTGATQQAAFTKNQIASANPSTYEYLAGSSVFEYTPDYQNGPPGPPPPNNTYTFSLLIDNYGTSPSVSFPLNPNAPSNGSGGTVGPNVTYPVQCLYTSNPVYAAVRALWNPNASSPSPASYCATAPPG